MASAAQLEGQPSAEPQEPQATKAPIDLGFDQAIDPWLFFAAIALSCVGLVMIFSSSAWLAHEADGIVIGNGPGDPLGFGETLMPKVKVREGLIADGVVADLSGDGVPDIVLRGPSALYVVVPRRKP